MRDNGGSIRSNSGDRGGDVRDIINLRQLQLAQSYPKVRNQSVELAAGLSAEDCMLQSMPDASPVKWHLAHVTWFFETFILERGEANFEPFDAQFRVLFNSYYVGVGARFPRPERGLLSRPALERVLQYRANVDARLSTLLAGTPLDAALLDLIELGLHHEQQHQELILTDLKHHFSRNPLWPVYREAVTENSGKVAPLRYVAHAGGPCLIGHGNRPGGEAGADAGNDPDNRRDNFAFDNEMPRHEVLVAPFALASRLITNSEYLSFMEDGGYQRPELWLSDGWDMRAAQDWKAPLYWFRAEDQWHSYTLAGVRPLRADEPVCHVSYYEADACARWMDARLATEFEWECAARVSYSGGAATNFLEDGRFHPAPAPGGDANNGTVQQLFGDLWEWTQSAYLPYPGFRSAAGAVGEYNGKFMINQMVLRGGSCATPRDHVRASYRNFFPPQARWQFSGIRLARDLS